MKNSAILRTLYTALLVVNVSLNLYSVHPITRNFSKNEYGAGTQNWSITQDNENLVYFGNNTGLISFDGDNWNTIPIINGTRVHSILSGENNIIYASTFNDFGYFNKNKLGDLTYHSLVDEFNIKINSSNELTKIHRIGNKIYFQGEKCIYIYDGKKLITKNIPYIINYSTAVNDVLWIASDESGLFMLNGNHLFQVPGSEILTGKKIKSILEYKSNSYLITTSFDGLFIFDGKSVKKHTVQIDNFLKTNQVFCATRNSQYIVFGTVQRGIAIYNLKDDSFSFLNSNSGLQNNTVLCMMFDINNNLWLGLDKGIDFVMLNSPIRNIIGENEQYGSGYCSIIKNDKLYLGTNQGLYWTDYPLHNSPEPTKLNLMKGMEGQVWSLNLIDGTLFCGDDNGAFIIDGNSIQKIKELSGTWSFRKSRMYPDLIIGSSYKGLFVLKKVGKLWKFSHFIKGEFQESSMMFELDDNGDIWFSHWLKGLYKLEFNHRYDSVLKVTHYNESKGFPSNRYNTVFKIADKLVFSSEKGLYSHHKKLNRMEPNKGLNEIFNTTPEYMRLHSDSIGNLWAVSGRFLGYINVSKKNAKIDSVSYKILQSKIIPGFEHFNFITDKEVILSTEEGFSVIDFKNSYQTKNNFKLSFRSVSTTGEKSGITKINSFTNSESTKIEHKNNNLRFEFRAPEFRLNNAVKYSYWLENYDLGWSEPKNETTKEYNKIPQGNYIFKVRAINTLTNEDVNVTYKFSISPAWYETKTAFVIYLFIFLIIVSALVWFINHRSSLGAKRMEKIKELELQEKQKQFDEENSAKRREIKELRNQQLQYELRHKSQELASSTMNLIRKNEILIDVVNTFTKTADEIRNKADEKTILTRLYKMERNIRENIESDNNWKKFEENFDLVYENYLKRLGEVYPDLNVTDKKICAYIKMNLSSKDMSPLLNMSFRSIETNRYRIRKKLGLNREQNLTEFLQKF